MSTSRIRTLTLAALAAFTLAACGDDDASGPKLPAQGNARITLAAEGEDTTMNVDAFFGKDWDESEENRVFGIAIGAASENLTIVMARPDTTQPGVGNLAIANLTDEAEDPASQLQVALVMADETSMGVFVGKSGTVRITRSSAQALAGTVDMVVEGLVWIDGSDVPTEITMDVTGTFNATPAPAGAVSSALEARVSGLRVKSVR